MNSITFKRTTFLFVFLLLLIPNMLPAQVQHDSLLQKGVLNLEDAIKVAVANNPEVNRAILSVQDADQMVRIAYSEVFPNVSSSMNYTRNIETPVNYLPAQIFDPDAPDGELIGVSFGTDNNWQGGFSVTQNIFQGDVFVGLSTSTIFKTVQQENLRATTQQIITQTRQAYHRVLVAKEQLRLQEAQIKRLEANLRENRSRNRAGLVDDYAVLQIEVQLSNQRPSLIEARYAVKEAYRSLKQVLGIPLEFEFEVKGDLNVYDIVAQETTVSENQHLKRVDQMNPFTYDKSLEQWATMLDDRGDIRMLNANLDLRDKEILAIKSHFLPTLTASYNLQWSAAQPGKPTFFQNPEPNTDPNRFQTLAVNFSLPIFEGFRRMAEVQQAQIQRKDVEEQKRAARLNAQNEIASASETLNKAFETAEARRQALDQAREGYDRALKRLENGIGSQIEVTDAELQVRQAEVNYALMVYEYLNAKAQYDLATGQVPYVDTATYN